MAIHGHPAGNALTDATTFDAALADEVRTGLAQTPKRLSSRFFYDAEGSRLFQQIMHAPEYYLTRTEFAILDTYKAELRRLFAPDGGPFELVELGAGDGLKTKILLGHLLAERVPVHYVPVDISADALVNLTNDLQRQFPGLPVQPQHTDYVRALGQLSRTSAVRKVVLFLGSNVGNFSPDDATRFYRAMQERLHPGDLLLTGFDLQKHPAIIHAAYNDRQGLTRAFNLNLLRRINRELDADFDLLAFDHYESYSPETGEARSYVVSRPAQTVRIGALDLTVSFAAGEVIHTEISRKFTRAQIEQLAAAAGLDVVGWFTDEQAYFADVVFQKPGQHADAERPLRSVTHG